MSETKDTSSKTDIWIALGVIGCLAIGASATFVLSNTRNAETDAARAQMKEVPRGAPIVAHPVQATGTTPGSAASATLLKSDGEFLTLTFDTLGSYYYEIPNLDESAPATGPKMLGSEDAKANKTQKDQIPAPIHALNGKKVSIQGFMIPIKLEKGATKEFLIVKDQSVCCWGRVPRMNEWVSVRMTKDQTTKFIPDQPVTVFGTLQVGEEIVKGEVMSIYRLDADDVAGPLDL